MLYFTQIFLSLHINLIFRACTYLTTWMCKLFVPLYPITQDSFLLHYLKVKWKCVIFMSYFSEKLITLNILHEVVPTWYSFHSWVDWSNADKVSCSRKQHTAAGVRTVYLCIQNRHSCQPTNMLEHLHQIKCAQFFWFSLQPSMEISFQMTILHTFQLHQIYSSSCCHITFTATIHIYHNRTVIR